MEENYEENKGEGQRTLIQYEEVRLCSNSVEASMPLQEFLAMNGPTHGVMDEIKEENRTRFFPSISPQPRIGTRYEIYTFPTKPC